MFVQCINNKTVQWVGDDTKKVPQGAVYAHFAIGQRYSNFTGP